MLLPRYPLHWTTIIHYVLLLSALVILTIASDKAGVFFTILLAIFALTVGANMYSYLLSVPRFFIFLLRVVILGLPLVIAGMGELEEVRAVGFFMGALALPLLVSTFVGCWFPVLNDPRIAYWCI